MDMEVHVSETCLLHSNIVSCFEIFNTIVINNEQNSFNKVTTDLVEWMLQGITMWRKFLRRW